MNEEIKQEWIRRLRSGDYNQTQDELKDDKGYCCLGVLTDIFIDRHSRTYWIKHDEGYGLKYKDALYLSTLPYPVKNWAGLGDNPTPYISIDNTSLVLCNDVKKMSFDEIADLIEEKL